MKVKIAPPADQFPLLVAAKSPFPRCLHRAACPSFGKEDLNMKVIGISSSPHTNGNGAALVREALEKTMEAEESLCSLVSMVSLTIMSSM